MMQCRSSGNLRVGPWFLTVVLVVSVAMGGEVAAQGYEGPQWELSAEMGIEEVASRDDKGSPLAYSGKGFPLVLRAEMLRLKWSGGVEAGGFAYILNGGELHSALAVDGEEGHRAESVSVNLSAWAQRNLLDSGSRRLSLGLQLSHWTFFRSYLYDPAQIGAVETWEAPITADIRLEWRRLGERLDFGVATSAALAGRILRPAHSLRGDERFRIVDSRIRVFSFGDWTAAHRLQMVQAQAVLRWRIHGRWGVNAQYRFGWMNYRNQEATRASTQRIVGGVHVRF